MLDTHDITSLGQLGAWVGDFAGQLRGGDVIGLRGPLGSGKTTFVKALGRALGIEAEIISPTYLYEQSYELPTPARGIERLHHLDLYRIDGDRTALELGLTMRDPQGLTIVEWIEHAPHLQGTATWLLDQEVTSDGQRSVSIERQPR